MEESAAFLCETVLREHAGTLVLPGKFCDALLDGASSTSTFRGKGVPQQPYYREVSRIYVCLWVTTGTLAHLNFVEFPLLTHKAATCDRLQEKRLAVEEHLAEGSAAGMTALLNELGTRDALTLLRMRTTDGSVSDMLPPPISFLLNAFDRPNKEGRLLTVGARALCKHAVRCAWWGEPKGPEAAKNSMARAKVTAMLEEAAWVNTFMLPHAVVAFEIRVASGYGARWSQVAGEEWVFRGFVEPPMEDGHLKGWKH